MKKYFLSVLAASSFSVSALAETAWFLQVKCDLENGERIVISTDAMGTRLQINRLDKKGKIKNSYLVDQKESLIKTSAQLMDAFQSGTANFITNGGGIEFELDPALPPKGSNQRNKPNVWFGPGDKKFDIKECTDAEDSVFKDFAKHRVNKLKNRVDNVKYYEEGSKEVDPEKVNHGSQKLEK